MKPKQRLLAIFAASLLATFGIALAVAMYAQFTADRSNEISTSIAVPKPPAPREVKSVLTDSAGDLIITYTDGSTQNAGHVVGKNGDGQAPTQAQISAALLEYCANGRCDSKAPTQQQIVDALNIYCAGGICKGKDGASAAPITAEQITLAVSSYCADGRCKGADGQSIKGDTGEAGPQGPAGETTVLSCVTRTSNGVATNYIAWKYVKESVSLYRDLYKLPVWAEASNCIDLR
ncbi:hypothetical protein QM806_04305 [Rhodococcus sp. IEGM 1351]|uniref:hypothetical protein n=1 Tax=Rhodococcus sp. IEGM 1351 TaxID=3047089 RepID=UPI0024B7C9E8|nr:hypothetical protein [Rhodococcus sp. IEGM 1351]MDI9934676.1 hypothetical protein [Rhodococcus sp. IEGM 1351]